jgi:hypothetical protein
MSLPLVNPPRAGILPTAPPLPPDEPGDRLPDSLADLVVSRGKDELHRLLCLVTDPLHETLHQHQKTLDELKGFLTASNSIGIFDVAVLGANAGHYSIAKHGYYFTQLMSQTSVTISIYINAVTVTMTLTGQQTYNLVLPDGARITSASASQVNINVHYTNRRFGIDV